MERITGRGIIDVRAEGPVTAGGFRRCRDGAVHRAISMAPGLCAVVATSVDFHLSGDRMVLASIGGAILWTLLGFMAPVILTQGFHRPIPPSDHLALGSRRARSVMFVLGFVLLFGPGVLRLLGRLVGAV
jgi:hypothetical protein